MKYYIDDGRQIFQTTRSVHVNPHCQTTTYLIEGRQLISEDKTSFLDTMELFL